MDDGIAPAPAVKGGSDEPGAGQQAAQVGAALRPERKQQPVRKRGMRQQQQAAGLEPRADGAHQRAETRQELAHFEQQAGVEALGAAQHLVCARAHEGDAFALRRRQRGLAARCDYGHLLARRGAAEELQRIQAMRLQLAALD